MRQEHEGDGCGQDAGHVQRADASFRSGGHAPECLNQRCSGKDSRPDAPVAAFRDAAHKGQHEQHGERRESEGMHLTFRRVQGVGGRTQRGGKPQAGKAVQTDNRFPSLLQAGQGIKAVFVRHDRTRRSRAACADPHLRRAGNLVSQIKPRVLLPCAEFRRGQSAQRQAQPERSGSAGAERACSAAQRNLRCLP